MIKTPDFDAVVIGAGISGMYQLYRLRELGYTVKGVEASDNIGGVWHQNRYPGCRVDSESDTYGYFWNKQLLQEFNWSERFASQPEVLRYLHRAAELMDIRKDYLFNTRVKSATYDEANNLWRIEFVEGGSAPMTARFLVSALGPLSAPQMPKIDGVHTFKGETYHTGRWPRDPNGFGPDPKVDFRGKRVAVIGTGSSGVQVIQEVSKVAKELVVYQRSPNWCAPLGNGPLAPEEMEAIKQRYDESLKFLDTTLGGFAHIWLEQNATDVSAEEREATLEKLYNGPGFSLWLGNYKDVLYNPEANRLVSDFVARKIRQRVKDPKVADKLIPKDHGFGLRRIPLETKYFECYNQDNVTLVDIKETPIERITPQGIATADGLREFDVIVFATGFDAILGSWNRMDIIGRGGVALKDAWKDGVQTYLGMQIVGFPNFFTLVGAQSGATFCNIPRCSALIIDWLSEFFAQVKQREVELIEPTPQAQAEYTALCHKLLGLTLIGRTNSWFTGINKNLEGRDKRDALLWAGGNPGYRELLDKVSAKGYEGLVMK
ncbi:MAG: NAD(P)/FAD-dependent oxidoreductase [Pseudomonadota bacterium]